MLKGRCKLVDSVESYQNTPIQYTYVPTALVVPLIRLTDMATVSVLCVTKSGGNNHDRRMSLDVDQVNHAPVILYLIQFLSSPRL